MVPKPVPEAVANKADAANVMTVNAVLPTPRLAATPAMAAARPEERRMRENTPANSQQTTGVIASLLDIPSMMVLAYSPLFFAKKKEMTRARKAGSHKAPSEIEPGIRYPSTGHPNAMEEYVVVTEGELTLEIAGNVYVLGPGDSITFAGDEDHAYKNCSNKLTVFQSLIRY